VGRGKWSPERQAKTLKELGFDGISYNYTTVAELAARQKACAAERVKIYGLYVYTYLDQPDTFAPGFREAIKLLKGTDTIIWMAVRETKTRKKEGFEARAVEVVREMADLAAAQGVRVALYGHAGFYVENGADAARLARLVERTNVAPSINLCHEFASKQEARLDETLRAVAPLATLVSINGVDVAGKKTVVRLDQGDFEVAAYVRKLQAAGYRGPIGLQCFGVPGDPDENLKAARDAWERIRRTLVNP
jgi:sugar phosphate isomerase/epimerase